jgi:GNAT superfamily N-acetyltransferase
LQRAQRATCGRIDVLTFAVMELRRAEPTDAIAIARVHVRSWQAAYRKLMPDDYLDQLRPEDRAERYDFGNLDPLSPQTIIATESGEILGFATTSPAQEPNMPDYGELCALYVDPDHWGRGVGVALVSAARASLFDLGFRSAILWVLVGNVRAERFYLKDHWTPDGIWRTQEVWGIKVKEVRYKRKLEAPER